jgi:anti-sigma regulatory factor (Ser/Thr protein kinase)
MLTIRRDLAQMVSWELTLEPNARSVRLGRDLIHRVLAGADEDRVETAAILTDELVANAVTHGRPPISLAINQDARGVTVQVTDCGPGTPVPRSAAPVAESGRGLVIVDVLSDGWGVDDLPGGKRVWFRIAANGRAR